MSRLWSNLIMCFCLLLLTATLAGQDDPLYTRSEQWEVKRQDWSRFIADFERVDKPALEKMFDDGKISEWGVESYTLHSPGEYTHGYFYSSNGMGPLSAAGAEWLEAVEASGFTEHEFAPMVQSHRDQIFRNIRIRSKGGKYENAFAFFAEFHVEPWQGTAYNRFWDERTAIRMQALFEEGKIIAYGLLREEVSTREPTWRLNWYIAASAEAYDEAQRAFAAYWQELSEEERTALVEEYRSLVQEDTLREGMSNLLYYQVTDK